MGTRHREAVGKRTQGGEVEKHTTGVGVVIDDLVTKIWHKELLLGTRQITVQGT